jgi:electron transport complex protein RnfD
MWGLVASFAAIGLGKTVFGGLGMNLFNPAMVGRAFVMISFSVALGSGAYVAAGADLGVLTQATPLAAAKAGAELEALWPLFVGNVNGSLGETSALMCLLGGAYLVWRRASTWEVPVLVIAGTALFGGLAQLAGVTPEITVLEHLLGGALFFGAFFIATDPVSSPITFKGRVIFALGIAFFVVLIRQFSGYPEGVMFAVLLMNAVVPLLNNATVPVPHGGPVPERKS